MSDQTEKRLSWLSFVFDSALKHGVFRPADVIVHATPDLLALHLPKELQIRTLDVGFEQGKMTPEVILGVNPPSTLVKHIAPSVLWEVVRDAAVRHGISAAGNTPKTGKTPVRNWIAEVVGAGIEKEIYTPADVTRHIPPAEWVRDVPLEVVAKMIAAGLTRPQFDPRLALEHLSPVVIGEFVNPTLSWAVIDEGAVRAFELGTSKAAPRAAAVVHATTHTAAPAAPQAATAAAGGEPAAPAVGDWDTGMADSADSWVDEVVDSKA